MKEIRESYVHVCMPVTGSFQWLIHSPRLESQSSSETCDGESTNSNEEPDEVNVEMLWRRTFLHRIPNHFRKFYITRLTMVAFDCPIIYTDIYSQCYFVH